MKPNDNRLYIYPRYDIEPVVVDPHMGTGELDYEWQAKLVMHEILSKPLDLTQTNLIKMLADSIMDREKYPEDNRTVYTLLWDCFAEAWKEVHNKLNLLGEENDGK